MGMYDTVKIKCPHCDETHSEQTKSGPCHLIETALDRADPAMIAGLYDSDGNITCEHCSGQFRIEMVNRPTYRTVSA